MHTIRFLYMDKEGAGVNRVSFKRNLFRVMELNCHSTVIIIIKPWPESLSLAFLQHHETVFVSCCLFCDIVWFQRF